MNNALRRFNEAGIAEFVRRIQALRSGDKADIDDAFVTDPSLTEMITPVVQMERHEFQTKRDAGAYLSEKTRAARKALGDDDPGLWTWLSAWHWDVLCPVKKTGVRQPISVFYYVYAYGITRSKNQHLLAVSVKTWERAPQSNVMLASPVSTLTRAVHEISAHLSVARIKSVFDLIDVLYWDRKAARIKRGAVSSTPRSGDLRNRFFLRLAQLELTHDLTDLTAEQLLALLGAEFQAWASPPKKSGGGGGGPRRPRVPAAH